jgi:hypothetical protein
MIWHPTIAGIYILYQAISLLVILPNKLVLYQIYTVILPRNSSLCSRKLSD